MAAPSTQSHIAGQSMFQGFLNYWGYTKDTHSGKEGEKSHKPKQACPGCDNSGFKIGNTRASHRQTKATTKPGWKSRSAWHILKNNPQAEAEFTNPLQLYKSTPPFPFTSLPNNFAFFFILKSSGEHPHSGWRKNG